MANCVDTQADCVDTTDYCFRTGFWDSELVSTHRIGQVDLCWTGVDSAATVFNLWLTSVDLSTMIE
ncbi:hypothetical protein Taro_014344 [Colocasia esculenta]|uniref:Uncharacterized protein n=1 Tax=Colocasia esculenta TaxID=4460 RepID=A0A843UIS2_COLES|nr:hypothetical protein [Colocasia esculenta]